MNCSRREIPPMQILRERWPHLLLERRPHHQTDHPQIQKQQRRLANSVSRVAFSFRQKSSRDKRYSHDDLYYEIEIRLKRGARAKETIYWKDGQGSKAFQEQASTGNGAMQQSRPQFCDLAKSCFRRCCHLGGETFWRGTQPCKAGPVSSLTGTRARSLCLLKYSFSSSRSCNRARHRRAFTAAGLKSRTSAV